MHSTFGAGNQDPFYMSVLIILIGVSLFLASGFLIAFIWSVKKGQYEDEYTPSIRMLLDDPESKDEKSTY